jgi:hypothetical protein
MIPPSATPPAPSPFQGEANPPFHVVIAYDRADSARHAMSLVDGLAARFGGTFRIRRDLWRFDILDLPAMQGEAATSAARANLLIIAADGDEDLPAPAKRWVRDWTAATVPGNAALAAALQTRAPHAQEPSTTLRFLREMAHQAGQEFFAGEFGPRPAPEPR